jgi:NADH pyrophosphatase NudC (nudix superfamily)
VFEEIGLKIDKVSFTGQYTTEFEGNKVDVLCFSASTNANNFSLNDQEIFGIDWFLTNNLPDQTSGTVDKILDLHSEAIKRGLSV